MTESSIIESVVMGGDLSKLSTEQRLSYYKSVCDSIGVNPLTRPFDYITLNGKLTLYARKDATDQLRKIHDVSITKLERERIDTIYTVTAYAQDKSGRMDSSIGAVNIDGLKGDALANALMKSETKAKRRVTLSLCGLGILDETELETIPEEVMEPVRSHLNPHTEVVKSSIEMTLEEANSVTNTEGASYGDLSSETLANMSIGINKGLKKSDLTSAKQDEYMRKLEAIRVILNSRALLPAA